MTFIPFARWRPDNAHLNSPYASDVLNVLCAETSYLPFPQLVPLTAPLAGQPLGGITVRDTSGQVHIFAGTATKLWKLNNTTLAWEDVSKPAATYAATPDERWRFRQFGNFVVAVNISNAPQVYQLNLSSGFADLGGAPPFARHIAVWGDQLALMDDDTVYWSDIDDITNWSTQNAGSQPFPDGGVIQGATDATNPIIFQKSAIRFGTFVPGSLEVFTFHKVHDKRGCAAPYSICTRGDFTFFADSGAFYQIQPNGAILPIGFEKVDRTIFQAIAGDALATIYGEIDPFFPRVYFAISVSSTAAFDRLIIYDWQIGEWTQIDMPLDILFPLASGTIGYTLEGLDALSASIENLPYPLDSKAYQGGAPVMAAFDSNFRLGFFQGQGAEATIVTQEMGDEAGGVQRFSACVPVIDVDDFAELKVSVGARMRRKDIVTWTPEFTPSSNTGVARKRSRARFHRFRIRISAGAAWSHAQGISVSAQPAGQR
jgi:hypothetical protein